MTKFCTNCGKELDENAAMCLNCGKIVGDTSNLNTTTTTNNSTNSNGKQKKKGLPGWAIALIVIGCVILIPIIILIVLGIIGYNVIKDKEGSIKDYIEDNLPYENRTLTGTIGDTLKADDLKVTLNSALMYSSIPDEYFPVTPAEGKEFLVFTFDVENISDESVYISSSDFDGYVDGYSVSSKYIFTDINGTEELAVNLSPGMKAKGYVAYEIDTTWKSFEVHYEEFDFDDDNVKLVFKVVNEDSSGA